MGTLFSQSERERLPVEDGALSDYVGFIKQTARDHDVSFADVVEAARVLEMARQNELHVRNGDAWDEQIAGIGEILSRLADSLEAVQDEMATAPPLPTS